MTILKNNVPFSATLREKISEKKDEK